MRRLTAFLALLLCLSGAVDAQRLVITDSGGVERTTSRMCVVDSGGTTRCLTRAFVVDSGGTARLVFTSGEVVLEDAATSDTNPGLLVKAGFVFQPDGTIDAIGDTVIAPNGLNWFSTAPVPGIGANYQIRRTDAGSYDVNAAAQNEWVDLSVSREWSIRALGASSPTNEGENLVIEIREGTSGAAEDSAIFSMNISN